MQVIAVLVITENEEMKELNSIQYIHDTVTYHYMHILLRSNLTLSKIAMHHKEVSGSSNRRFSNLFFIQPRLVFM